MEFETRGEIQLKGVAQRIILANRWKLKSPDLESGPNTHSGLFMAANPSSCQLINNVHLSHASPSARAGLPRLFCFLRF